MFVPDTGLNFGICFYSMCGLFIGQLTNKYINPYENKHFQLSSMILKSFHFVFCNSKFLLMLKPLCYREHRRMSQVLWRTQEAYDKKRQCGLVPRTLTAHELIPLIQFLFLLKDSFVPHDNKTICSFPTCFLYKARRKTFFPEVESKVPSVL